MGLTHTAGINEKGKKNHILSYTLLRIASFHNKYFLTIEATELFVFWGGFLKILFPTNFDLE